MPKKIFRGRMVVVKKSQTVPRVRRILAGTLSTLAVIGLMGTVLTGIIQADSGSWAEGDMPVLTLGESSDGSGELTCSPDSIKYTAYYGESGNYLNTPREVTSPACVTANGLGKFANPNNYNGYTSFEFIQPNTSFAYRILDPSGRQKSLTPIPNQNRYVYFDLIGYTATNSIRIMDNFGAHGTFGKFGFGSGVQKTEMAYRFNTLPDRLVDAAGQPIGVRSRAFSNNGEWMVVQANQGLIRINTKTNEMLLFSNLTLTYDLGYAPWMRLTISDDGQAVVSTIEGEVRIHDLQGCQPAPINTQRSSSSPAGCKSRPVDAVFRAQVTNFISSFDLHFTDGGKSLDGKLVYGSGDNLQIRLYRHFTLTVADYRPPRTSYLALGDSFSSGEGAFEYEQGTDEDDPHNLCHLSKKSYPYLAANVLGLGEGQFHSVACSGAKMRHYDTEPQNLSNLDTQGLKDSWLPGIKVQRAYFDKAGKTDAVTISMIGNDIGFSNKLKRCLAVGDSCFRFREDRIAIVNEINNAYGTLIKLYGDIKKDSGRARVYVMGYPQLFSTEGECAYNAPLDGEERAMSRGMVSYLNAVIRTAASNAGVKYIDIEDAFAGRELCGTESPKVVNGLTRGNDAPSSNFGPLGNESFHPNGYGHQLMSQALLAQSDNLTLPMPAVPDAANAAQLPAIGSTVYRNFVDNVPSGGTLQRTVYVTIDTIGDVVIKGQPINIAVPLSLPLQLRDTFEFWFNSEPIYAGSLATDEIGNLQGSITVPEGLEPGFHTLHMYGHNIAGETIDVSQTVYVAASETDYDADGVANQDEACLVGESAGIDQDRDGIDDACDGEIDETPVDTVPPVVRGVPDREPNANGWYDADTAITWMSVDSAPSSGMPTQPALTAVSTEGEHEYTSEQSCDPAGNCSTGTYAVKLDKTAPVLGPFNWSRNPKPNDQTALLTVNAADVLSGVTEAEYFLGDTDPGRGHGATMAVNEDGTLRTTHGTDFPTGVYKVSVRAKDAAGNWSAPVSDYLVVYDPTGTRMTGRRTVRPSLTNGDVLPGLNGDGQDDIARFGLNVRYDSTGKVHRNSDFQFVYHTGTKCHRQAQAQNCHRFDLNATSIHWLTTQGTNASTGIFQGTANLVIDGTTTTVLFRLTGVDGERLDSAGSTPDSLSLHVYRANSDPNTVAPLYRVDSVVERGNIRIRVSD